MSTQEFVSRLSEDFQLYLVLLSASVIIYIVLYRRYIESLWDPLFFQSVASCFGLSVVLFLFFIKAIDFRYFLSYLTTQVAFFAGFMCLGQRPFSKMHKDNHSIFSGPLLMSASFMVISTVHILFQLLAYATTGIPIMQTSRLETFAGGSGIGVIARLINILIIAGPYLAFHCLKFSHKIYLRISARVYLVIVGVFFLLSGSRSGMITFFFVYYLFSIQQKSSVKSTSSLKNIFIYIGLACLAFLLMLFKAESPQEAWVELFSRIVGFGDVYWSAYPDRIIEMIPSENAFLAVFGDITATYRIVSWEEIPKSVGLQLYKLNYPSLDITFGPNGRHNVFGYIYFGAFGSLLFSFILGFILGTFRTYGFRRLYGTGLSGMLYAIVYLKVVSLESDITFVVGELNSLIISFFALFPLIIIVFLIFYNERKRNAISRHSDGDL